MSREEMREGFEAWHCEQYKTKHTTGEPTRDMHNGVRDENYCSKKSQALWECWQETDGDVAKVEALKEAIERIELGKQAVAHLMLGDIFHGVDGPEVDDWDIQYDHKVCEALAQMSPGAQIPLFTRSDAGEVDRLNTVVEQQKNLIASLRAELRESYSIGAAPITENHGEPVPCSICKQFCGDFADKTCEELAADQRNSAMDIEAAAKKLAACMDYPWEHMPEQGRASMREHATAVIGAALNPVKSGVSA